MTVDFRRCKETSFEPVVIDVVEFYFLGTIIREDVSWTEHIFCLVGEAHQRLNLRKLWRAGFSFHLSFCKTAIESVLTYHISLWQGMYMVNDSNVLQRVIKTAQKIIKGAYLPSTDKLSKRRCL